jgi:hypothetical protein
MSDDLKEVQGGTREDRDSANADVIKDFLAHELPPSKTKEAPYLTVALLSAGARYNLYVARKKDWRSYAKRRGRFNRIAESAFDLVMGLTKLDVLSRDNLSARFDSNEINALIGLLVRLNTETHALANETQKDGKPRDLAEEYWISEIADIYENAFGQPARVWGSGAGPKQRRGKFYRLLELCRPTSFSRHGKLHPRQVDRILKERKGALKGWAALKRRV